MRVTKKWGRTIRITKEVSDYLAAHGKYGETPDAVLRRRLIGFKKEVLKSPKMSLMTLVIMILSCCSSLAGESRYRDANGRTVGYSSTRTEKTTFRDSNGRMAGTATTRSGKTTFRDRDGKLKGTISRKGTGNATRNAF
jgi:hypothetical protein